jgi:4-hydroxy-tetrahydrodipicolinate reductase
MSPVRLAVVGAAGRMGRAVVRLASSHGLAVVRAVARSRAGLDAGTVAGVSPSGVLLEEDPAALASGGFDVLVDFSSPAVAVTIVRAAIDCGAALVSGTTGLTPEGEAALNGAGARIAALWEPNMSVGVHVLLDLVRRAAAQLGPEFDVEVAEAHHRLKVDAPSGTALRLVEALREVRREAGLSAEVVHGRQGTPGPRRRDEIAVHALRGGDVIGDHTVHLLGPGERLELTHRATDRDVFAHGALRAAAFLAGRPAGRYRLEDVLASKAR